MFNFFSSSSSKGRYPNPNRGGSHYQRGGFFRNFGSFSSSGSGRRRYNQNQQPYPNQGYPQQSVAQGSSQVCPNCGTQVPAGSKFCLSCGAKMNTAVFCTNCGKPVPPGSKFCPQCGSPVNQ
ncbi:MAG TPA: zinc ribbon domain-containing protein [Candidatus Blautia pullistercoris]|uniref:Zinc ribbon domain-containing protein n=1 Tax=Candidatus Blautia pullistercoris TaxID=2838499 RepID=A0A9D1VMF2_9FIRM|nr:zinc ribbon domain-containing protein [Candidatus Blautia pullistercoris]